MRGTAPNARHPSQPQDFSGIIAWIVRCVFLLSVYLGSFEASSKTASLASGAADSVQYISLRRVLVMHISLGFCLQTTFPEGSA